MKSTCNKKKEDKDYKLDEEKLDDKKKKLKSLDLTVDDQEKNIKSTSRKFIEKSKMNKNVIIFSSESEELSSSSESEIKEKKFLNKKILRKEIGQGKIQSKSLKPVHSPKTIESHLSSDSDEIIPIFKKQANQKYPKILNQNKQENPVSSKINSNEKITGVIQPKQIIHEDSIFSPIIKNNKTYEDKFKLQNNLKEQNFPKKEENFDLINSYNLENIEYLKENYPNLFEKGTSVLFRIYELSIEHGGPAPSGYKTGKIEEFVEETKFFLIKLEEKDENLESIYSYETDEGQFISVHVKDMIELRVEKSEKNKYNLNKVLNNLQNENHSNSEQIMKSELNTTNINEIVENVEKSAPKGQQNVFTKILHSQIKKQIEYYFSDKNYYKDKFLLEKASLNENNCNYIL